MKTDQFEVAHPPVIQGGLLSSLLEGCPTLPYRFINGIPRANVVAYLSETIFARHASPSARVVTGFIDEALAAVAVYESQAWESNILGKKTASLSLYKTGDAPSALADCLEKIVQDIVQIAREDGCELVTAKTYSTDMELIHALQKQGFLLMDTMVDVVYQYPEKSENFPEKPAVVPEFTTRLATSEDIDQLRTVAEAAFKTHFGRYHADPKIGRSTATKIYIEWIEACVNGWGDWVFVAQSKNSIAGFSVWKKPNEGETRHGIRLGHYSIGAIHPDFKGRGLFKYLTHEGIQALRGMVDFVEGPTHVHNLAVQRGYLKLGWKIPDSRHSFHKWI